MKASRGLCFLLLGALSACAGRRAPIVTTVVVQLGDSCDETPRASSNVVEAEVRPRVPAPSGLQGDLYFIPQGTSALPDFSSLKKVSSFKAASLNVPMRYSTEGFPGVQGRQEWFAIDFHGTFAVEDEGQYRFQLTADDGAELFIDGEKLISNDGIHGPITKPGEVYLTRGLHTLRVPYFQGPQYHVALVLEVAQPGEPFAVFNTKEPLVAADLLE